MPTKMSRIEDKQFVVETSEELLNIVPKTVGNCALVKLGLIAFLLHITSNLV